MRSMWGIGNTSPSSTLQVTGSMAAAVTLITTSSNSTTLTSSHYCIVYSGAINANTITLPTASTCSGRMYLIVNHSNTSVTTSTYTTANGTTSASVAAGANVQIISDGSNWHKIN